MAQVKAVCVSSAKGQPKTAVERVQLKAGFGIVGDAHAEPNSHRQVSLLDHESIDVMRRAGYDAAHGDFGENIVTQGLNINQLGIGTILQVGPAGRLRITQIGKACHRPCAIARRTGRCIMPTDGLFAVVLDPGSVAAEDQITIVRHISRETIQAAVITVSDRCHAGRTTDTAGPLALRMLHDGLKCHIAEQSIVPDEHDVIVEHLLRFSERERRIDLIFTTGGTGFSPRDVTPEATNAVIERPAPGIAETIRQAGLAVTPTAMLSRATAGIRNQTLIVNLPGSAKAVRESLEVIIPVLPHAVELLRAQAADCGRNQLQK